MNVTIITGNAGSGRTKYLLDNTKRTEDNLIVTTDASVYYIEKAMAINKISGKCVGISSLADFIGNEIGGISEDVISEELQSVVITEIMRNNFKNLKTLKLVSFDNTLASNVSSFINNCLIEQVAPEDLLKLSSEFGTISRDKLEDISFIYSEFLQILKKKKLLNKIMYGYKICKILDSKFSYKNIYVDSLDKYNRYILELIESLSKISDNFYIAFSLTSPKSYAYNIYQNSNNAYISFDSFVTKIPGCIINRVALKAKKDITSGMNIIQNELFNRGTNTEYNGDEVYLHEASTFSKEIDFVSSEILKLVDSGKFTFDDIIITSTNMAEYRNFIMNSLRKNKINSYYYKNKKVDNTTFYSFINTIFKCMSAISVDDILFLAHLNYFGLTKEEVEILDLFFLRFGKDYEIAMKNGEIYDNDNYILVKAVCNKVIENIEYLKKNLNKCKTYADYSFSVYEYCEYLNLNEFFFNQYRMLSPSEPQLANEILETWNCIIEILEDISDFYEDKICNFSDFYNCFNKLCKEKIVLNSQEYCNEVKILDLKDARNRKSKICFVVGCNEGAFPFDVKEGLFADFELEKINNFLKVSLETSKTKTNDAYHAIYSVLTLPSDKLYISWSECDPEARPIRSASILNNIIKIFQNNVIKEEKYYENNKEEMFYELLNNLSEYKKVGMSSEHLDDIYWELSENPAFSERLNNAIKQAVTPKNKINSDINADAYREHSFFGVTELEKFNQCPFKHFIDYGLIPTNNKVFEENAANKGDFYHSVLNSVFSYIKDNGINIKFLDYENFLKIINPIIDKNINLHNENVLDSDTSLFVEKEKMIRRVTKTAWHAILQLKEGLFDVFKTEFRIGRDIPLKLTLSNGENVNIVGIIDRIDETEIDSNKYVRVIDYKSGGISFSEEKMKLGIQLQLPLYMKAIVGDYKPAGIYYTHIVEPIKDADNKVDNIEKKYQLKGLTVEDNSILEANDMVLGGTGVSSNIIQADITTKGEISKKSKVMKEEDFNAFLDEAVDIAVKTITEILNGETIANPVQITDFNACEYCPYKSICHIN